MTVDRPTDAGRFGTAAPGMRPSPPSLEALLAVPQPPPGRGRWTRRRALLLAGIVAVVAIGYAAGHFTWPRAAVARPTELVVTSTALPAGARLTPDDFRNVPVQPGASEPAGALTPAAAARLIGLVTARAVPAGTFLERSLLAHAGAVPNSARSLVGLALKPGQLPVGGLSDGQQVLVVMLRASSDGTVQRPVPLVVTTVWNLQGPGNSEATLATVVVPEQEAALLSGYAAQGDVALVATATASASPLPTPSATPKPSPKPKSSKSGTRPASHRSHKATRSKKAGR